MPAYNHAPYIAEAIESVLMQQTDFRYELVIGEDCSTDDTRAVAVEYATRYPDRVRVLLHERNLGIFDNDQAILRACRGEYIAWLEADDYWTSPHKLQKQVALLETHPDYSACFHWARRVGEGDPATWRHGPSEVKPYYTIDDLLLHGHFIPSCTAVFRADLVRTPAEWTRATPFLERTYSARFALAGKIGFLDEELAVFRYNPRGIYAQATRVGNVESAIATHELIGQHLGVAGRDSYRRGLERLRRELRVERGDYRRQVGKTVNQIPVPEQTLDDMALDVIEALELTSDDGLLDLCCGNGLITSRVAARVRSVAGVDRSESLIAVARADFAARNIEYIVADVTQLPEPLTRRAFSKIAMYEALQNFSTEQTAALLRTLAASASGGAPIFLGSIPDRDRIWNFYDSRERRQEYERRVADGTEAIGHWWTAAELRDVAAAHGYDLEIRAPRSSLHVAHYRFDALLTPVSARRAGRS